MTERERLFELLENGFYEAVSKCKGEDKDKKACDFLADYLIENGVIVPPVKTGGTVYINGDETDIYEALGVEGHEEDALNYSYLDLYKLLGKEAMLKLFNHFRGDKIECPMRMYRAEYIADLAKQTTDRRERAKIARAGGYTLKFIEGILSKRKNENEDNLTREGAEKALEERKNENETR